MSTLDRVHDVVVPVVEDLGAVLYDLELAGGTLRVTIDEPDGVSLDTITLATRLLSRALDDAEVMAGHYTLEVSSPGLERVLRTPEHYAGAVGSDISVKTVPSFEGDRRLTGRLAGVEPEGIVLLDDDGSERRVGFDDIQKARTVFVWGPAAAPGPGAGAKKTRPSQKARSR
jgi:ribosome maturation factor RimP